MLVGAGRAVGLRERSPALRPAMICLSLHGPSPSVLPQTPIGIAEVARRAWRADGLAPADGRQRQAEGS